MIDNFIDWAKSTVWVLLNTKHIISSIWRYQTNRLYVFRNCPDDFVLECARIYRSDLEYDQEMRGYYYQAYQEAILRKLNIEGSDDE